MKRLFTSMLLALPLAALAQGEAASQPAPTAAQGAQPPAAQPQAEPAPAQPSQPPAAQPQTAPPPQYDPPPPQGQYAPPPQGYPPPQGQYAPPPPGYVPPAQAQPQAYPPPPPGYYPYPPQQAYPQPPQYQQYPPPQPRQVRAPYQRDNWYIGFQVGGGAATIRLRDRGTYPNANYVKGGDYSMKEFLGSSPTTFDLDFQLGATITPKLLLGGQITAFAASAVYDSPAGRHEASFTQSNLNLLATFFPWDRGLFLRGGLGLASASATFKDPGYTDQKEEGSGLNATVGLGWAWWLGRSFNLTGNLDWSGQGYDGDFFKSGSLLTLNLGFMWY